MRNRVQHIGIILLILLFTGYFGSTNLYYHTHLDGEHVVVHSHPHHSEDARSLDHTHTRQECRAIQQMASQPVMFSSAVLHLPERADRVITVIQTASTQDLDDPCSLTPNGRAPPRILSRSYSPVRKNC